MTYYTFRVENSVEQLQYTVGPWTLALLMEGLRFLIAKASRMVNFLKIDSR